MHGVVLGCTMPLMSTLTMKGWEDIYKYIYIWESTCICVGKKSLHWHFIVHDGFWDGKYKYDSTTNNKCTNKMMIVLLFTITVAKKIFFGSNMQVYENGK